MFAYDKFDVYRFLLSNIDSGSRLTYSPLIRECFHFCLSNVTKNPSNSGSVIKDFRSVKLAGVDKALYREKRRVKKVGYFSDSSFFGNILREFSTYGVKHQKLNFLPVESANQVSNKQLEEIDVFDELLIKFYGVSIRDALYKRFFLMNGMFRKYCDYLQSTGVDAIFLRAYYIRGYFPIILACKVLGITVIDVQHGINGLKHPCYSAISDSEVGSPFFPDIFWTWSGMATKMLTNESSVKKTASIVEGGNPIFSRVEFTGGSKVLYTHQPQSKGIPIPLEEIRKICESLGGSVVLRPHPLHVNEASEAVSVLQKNKIKVEVEDPSKISINESLCETRIHITHSSTCALDALNFGIPSVFVSDYIGDVEKMFSTGLLFRVGDISQSDMRRFPDKAIDFSVGCKEKVNKAVASIVD